MISFVNASKQFGSKILYRDMTIAFNPSNRIGLIGPNGAGKSVLLRVIAGEDHMDEGEVVVPGNIRIGYLPQETDIDEEETPLNFVLAPFRHLLDGHEHHDGTDLAALSKLHDEMHVVDVYSLESRASSILSGLGIKDERLAQPMHELSGGFRMRVVLARLLLSAPDFLLLDEPTNHLDMDSLIWLERFLMRFDGGMLIVSHDRGFLNRMITHTAELYNGRVEIGKGNVAAYLEAKAAQRESEAKRVKMLNDQIEKTEAFIDRFKAKATKAAQARSRMKLLDRLQDELPDDNGPPPGSVHFRFPPAPSCGSVPLKAEKASVQFGDNVVLDKVDVTITRGQKVAVIGPNGAGKTTLLRMLAQTVPASAGTVSVGHNARIRFYAQHRLDQLDPRRTLYETISEVTGLVERSVVQNILGAFLFSGDDVNKTVGVCSGGEKSRLSLATLLADPGNVLLLDEPTNHLDLDAIEKLADALAAFDGTVVFVSHDEYLIERVADRIIEVRPGRLRDFPGTLAEYRWYVENGMVDESESAGGAKSVKKVDENTEKQERQKRREERKQLDRAVQKLEKKIEEIEGAIAEQDAILHDEENVDKYQLLSDTVAKLDALRKESESVMNEWTEQSERLATLMD